jgi:hypothetical protein
LIDGGIIQNEAEAEYELTDTAIPTVLYLKIRLHELNVANE